MLQIQDYISNPKISQGFSRFNFHLLSPFSPKQGMDVSQTEICFLKSFCWQHNAKELNKMETDKMVSSAVI